MRVVAKVRAAITPTHTPLPGWLRAPFAIALAIVSLTVPIATPVAAQSDAGWSFEDDAFADLWFHGLAMVGFYGFGPEPLYDPSYALAVRAERGTRPVSVGALDQRRDGLLRRLQGDEAFEILHFAPLYFRGAAPGDALDALTALAQSEAASGEAPAAVRIGTSIVGAVLSGAGQRATLAELATALEAEWTEGFSERRDRNAAARDAALRALQARWKEAWAPGLASFLRAERLESGTVLVSAALGAEGRFVQTDARSGRALVAVGLPDRPEAADHALSSMVRELCFPAVRRAFAPFEARLSDRIDASRASDLVATRCGELLLSAHAPERVATYRARFGIPPQGTGPGFLSASGTLPGAVAWEGQLEAALLRELNLVPDAARAGALRVGRDR